VIEQSDKEYFYSGSFFLCISLLLTIALFIPPDGLFQAEAAESFISVKEEYTDNLYLEEENKKDEYVTIMEAGIKLPAKSERRG